MTVKRLIKLDDIEPDTIRIPIFINLMPEGQVTGLAADSTGVKYTGKKSVLIDDDLLKHAKAAYIEVAKESSAGDETVTVELYDNVGAAVVASHTVTGTTTRSRSADILANLSSGQEIVVRWNVTTASATAGTTFDAVSAYLIIIKGVS